MDIIIISITAFCAALLTFFSGFGLGTILTPVFVLFFPIEEAIALTAIVHFFNNIFKLFLVGKNADRQVLIRFGIPAVIAALFGSWLLIHLSGLEPLYTYSLWNNLYIVYPVKFIIAIILIIFAFMDLIPYFGKIQFGKEKLPIGGLLSGFFGGLSGNQGALRSAFLIKAGLTKDTFIGTTVVVSTFVDMTRLSVYATKILNSNILDNRHIILAATLAGIAGSYLGNFLLKKVTLQFLQWSVAVLLIAISIAMGLGWI
ncbi:MAG: sulfite exporter TauE/SafE family protein [Saprospiraceae bacterium]